MLVAKVIGNLVATQKDESLIGSKLLLVKPLEIISGQKLVNTIVAVDSIGAGVGETVLISTGSSARNAYQLDSVADAAVVGIVDSMEVQQS